MMVDIYRIANGVTVTMVGVLLGVIARLIVIALSAQWDQLDAFVTAVRNGEPEATRRFDHIAQRYARYFGARLTVGPPMPPLNFVPGQPFRPAAEQGRPPAARKPGEPSDMVTYGLTNGSIRIERGRDQRKAKLCLGLAIFEFGLGLPASLLIFAMVGLALVLLISLLFSPLQLRLWDPVVLLAILVGTYLVVSRQTGKREAV